MEVNSHTTCIKRLHTNTSNCMYHVHTLPLSRTHTGTHTHTHTHTQRRTQTHQTGRTCICQSWLRILWSPSASVSSSTCRQSVGRCKHDGTVADNICVGLAKTIYIRCIHGYFGRKIIEYTVIYGAYIRFWPTLHMWGYNLYSAT